MRETTEFNLGYNINLKLVVLITFLDNTKFYNGGVY